MRLTQLLLTLSILCMLDFSAAKSGDWHMILPPDSARVNNLLGIFPLCSGNNCSVIVGFGTGEIYGVNLDTREITTYHLSAALQALAPHNVPVSGTYTFNTAITCFTVSGEQNMIYAADVNSGLWYMSLNPDSPYNTWQRSGPSGGSQVGQMIPMSTQTSTNLWVAYSYGNNYVNQIDPMYNQGLPIGTYQSKTNAVTMWYTNSYFENQGLPYEQDYVAVGTNGGSVSLFVLRNGVSTPYTLGLLSGGVVGKILNYRNGKAFWLIFNVYDDATLVNNRIWVYDLVNAGSQVSTIATKANTMTIYSDGALNDWLVFTNSSGIYKINMDQMKLQNPVVFSMGSPFNLFQTNQVNELIQTYLPTTDAQGNPYQQPALVVSSIKGSIALLADGDTQWTLLAGPMELWTEGNEIQDSRIVQDVNNRYLLLAVLNDGAILTQTDVLSDFTFGAPSVDHDEEYVDAQTFDSNSPDDYPAPQKEGVLSWNQLTNLANQDNIVVLTFGDGKGNLIDFQLEGYLMNTNPQSGDIASLKLSMMNTTNTQITMAKHQDLRFFFELLEIIEVTYEAVVWGIEVIETVGEFYYTATEIWNDIFG